MIYVKDFSLPVLGVFKCKIFVLWGLVLFQQRPFLCHDCFIAGFHALVKMP